MDILSSEAHIHNLARNRTPSMRYDGREDFLLWQKRSRAMLRRLLGMSAFQRCDPALEIAYEKHLPEFTETRFTFQSEEGYAVPCHFLVPAGVQTPLPVVVCLQGHSTGMHISLGRPKYETDHASINGDRSLALRAIRENYCALVIEQRYMGECGSGEKGEPACWNTRSAMPALLLGRTAIGERVWDVMRAIDLLEKHFPQADKNKILCMGNSGGGTATFYAACLEKRIKTAVCSCAFCTYQASIIEISHCECNYIPHIAKYFDMGDLGGLIAPRKLIVVSGREDEIFPIEGARESFDITRRLYAAAGAEKNCRHVIGDGGHKFYADDTWKAIKD